MEVEKCREWMLRLEGGMIVAGVVLVLAQIAKLIAG